MELKEENDNDGKNYNEKKENNIYTNTPEFYLLITGEAGKNNYGVLIRSASAFDCKEIFILGRNKNILKKFFGNHGTAKKMKYQFFASPEELHKHCIDNNIQIYGVDINYKKDKRYNSLPIQDINFENKKTLFILGNSMYPINKDLENIINKFTYVNQGENENIKNDLNLAVIGSICMHFFGVKNNYKMAGLNDLYNDEKYVVKTQKEIFYNKEENEKKEDKNKKQKINEC